MTVRVFREQVPDIAYGRFDDFLHLQNTFSPVMCVYHNTEEKAQQAGEPEQENPAEEANKKKQRLQAMKGV